MTRKGSHSPGLGPEETSSFWKVKTFPDLLHLPVLTRRGTLPSRSIQRPTFLRTECHRGRGESPCSPGLLPQTKQTPFPKEPAFSHTFSSSLIRGQLNPVSSWRQNGGNIFRDGPGFILGHSGPSNTNIRADDFTIVQSGFF